MFCLFCFFSSAFWRLITILVTGCLTLSLPGSRFFLWCFPKQNVCKLNFFLLYFALSFFGNIEWTMDIFVLFLIIITCFCFCSVNIISGFTWVSLFNNVLFFILFFYFLVCFNFQWFDMSVYAFFSKWFTKRTGWCCTCVWVRVSVCWCDLCECVCVSRAISGVGFLRCFLFTTFFFNFSLCFIYGACLLYLVG